MHFSIDRHHALLLNRHYAMKRAFPDGIRLNRFFEILGIFQRNMRFFMKCALLFLDTLGICIEMCIFQRNTHFFIHRQSTQFLTTLAFSNARGSLHLATNHVIMLFLYSYAHLVFFQRIVHFCNDTCISQRNTHFALKRAFCDETCISVIAANLPWMRYSNG